MKQINTIINLRASLIDALNANSGRLNNVIKCNNAIYANTILKPVNKFKTSNK